MLRREKLPPVRLRPSTLAPDATLEADRWARGKLPPIKASPCVPSLGEGAERRDPAPGPGPGAGAAVGAGGGAGEAVPAVPGSAARGQRWLHPPAAEKPLTGHRQQQLELTALRAQLAQQERDTAVLLSRARQREELLLAQVEDLKRYNTCLLLALKAQGEQGPAGKDSPTEPPMDVAEGCWLPWRGSISPRQVEEQGTQTNLPITREASTQREGPGQEHASTQTRALCLEDAGCQIDPLATIDTGTQTKACRCQRAAGHKERSKSPSEGITEWTQTTMPLSKEASTQAEGPGHLDICTQTRALCLANIGCQTNPLLEIEARTKMEHGLKKRGQGECADTAAEGRRRRGRTAWRFNLAWVLPCCFALRR